MKERKGKESEKVEMKSKEEIKLERKIDNSK